MTAWNLEGAWRDVAQFRRRKLAELLIQRKLLAPADLDACESDGELERHLVERGLLTAEQLAEIEREIAAPPLPQFPRYSVQRFLGEGATAIVYEARDEELRRPVALKVLRETASLSESARERFRREAQATAGLSHPNLVTLYDSGEADGKLYLVLERVEGRPLSALLSEGSRPERELLHLLEKAARGVAAAHAKGIVHRDLKPANILVGANGEPKVGDFGLAHLLDAPGHLTRSGTVLGTPLYMSPEQVGGDPGKISARTDVYALGAILYEILTGRAPHDGRTSLEMYRKIAAEDPVPPRALRPQVSREIEAVCFKAIEKDPFRRYESAAAFAEDLRRFLNGEAVTARPPSTMRSLARRIARHRVPAAATAVGIVFVALTALTLEWSRRRHAEYQDAYQAGLELWDRAVQASQAPGIDGARLSSLVEQASSQFRRAAELGSDRGEPWLMLGRARLLAGDPERAEAAWTEALRRDPGLTSARFERAKYYLGVFARLREVPVARLAVGMVRPGAPAAESERGREWRLKGEAELNEVRKGTGLGASERAYLDGALAYGEGRYPDAVRWLSDYTSSCPWDGRAAALLGYSQYGLGDFAAADAWLAKALRLERRAAWHAARGHARMCLARFPGALEEYDAALALEPDDADLICHRGLALQLSGRLEDAVAAYTRALERRPEFPLALNHRGTARAARQDLEGAEQDLRKVILIHPVYAEGYYNLANVLLLAGRVAESVEEYGRALDLDPGFVEAHVGRGLAHRTAGSHGRATEDFRKALTLEPTHPEALYGLAVSLEATGNRKEAISCLRQAVERGPEGWPRRAAAGRLLDAWSKP